MTSEFWALFSGCCTIQENRKSRVVSIIHAVLMQKNAIRHLHHVFSSWWQKAPRLRRVRQRLTRSVRIHNSRTRPGSRGSHTMTKRTPNVHFGRARHFKHHRNSTKRRPKRAHRVKFQAGEEETKEQHFGRSGGGEVRRRECPVEDMQK